MLFVAGIFFKFNHGRHRTEMDATLGGRLLLNLIPGPNSSFG